MARHRQSERQLVASLESALIYNEPHERIAFAMRSIIYFQLLGSEPSFVVVVETLEHKAISESREVLLRKLTANSCIALCSSTNAVSFSSARTTNRFPSHARRQCRFIWR
jgi:hypothetical protein